MQKAYVLPVWRYIQNRAIAEEDVLWGQLYGVGEGFRLKMRCATKFSFSARAILQTVMGETVSGVCGK